MPYKIVQTIERGKALLVAVPEQWEQDGVLYWPKKNIENLQKDENSKPNENWSPKNCIVKRNNIVNLLKAESIIDVMCENSDTETEFDLSQRTRQYQFKSKSNKSTRTQSNFNDMAEESSKKYNKRILNTDGLIELHKSEYFDKEESVVITQEAQSKVVTIPVTEQPQCSIMLQPTNDSSGTIHVSEEQEASIILQPLEDPRVMNDVLPKIDEISESLQTVTATLQTISENQQVLFTTQNKILTKLSEMQTQFEEIVKQLFKPARSQSSDIKPISSLKEFQNFENLLSTNDSTIMSELKNKLSAICSKGTGKGYNNAYLLIDVLFERHFLKNCSWAGGSTTDILVTKICFKSFTNTIKFFFNIIREADNQFTLAECHKFFKIILRNSRQRCDNKQSRLSAKKNRQKKIKPTPQSNPESAKSQVPANNHTPQSQPSENQQNQPQPVSMEVLEIVPASNHTPQSQPSENQQNQPQPESMEVLEIVPASNHTPQSQPSENQQNQPQPESMEVLEINLPGTSGQV